MVHCMRVAVASELRLIAPPTRAEQRVIRVLSTVTAEVLRANTAPPSPREEQLEMRESTRAANELLLTVRAPPPAVAEQPMMDESMTVIELGWPPTVVCVSAARAPPVPPAWQSLTLELIRVRDAPSG
eukprot:scaffold104115_cov67-Phaeocystis_antarctica.AAC.6